MPPVGLITVAAMFPEGWNLRLVDMNVRPLDDSDLAWADLVLATSMAIQQGSLADVVSRCNARGKRIVLGGPYPTSYHEDIDAQFESRGGGPDHYVLDEVERIFPEFLRDLAAGTARRTYREPDKPDVTLTPIPRFDLLDMNAYGSMAVQFSRGCPFRCEFCDITQLFGRIPRTKTDEQMLAEFDALRRLGWRGTLFIVDDNFIGNKRDALRFLAAARAWQEEHGYPFMLFTEASVNVVEIPGMLEAMADAGFNFLFLGIESPNAEALQKTLKTQNLGKVMDARTYLLQSIWKIQQHGMEVSGGFIIGLDGDAEFQGHLDFIRDAGIPRAMAGLLGVLKGTDLHARLKAEGRLLADPTGDNCDGTLNFVPELGADWLVSEYWRVVSELYEPTLSGYFDRCLTLLSRLQPRSHWVRPLGRREVKAFFMALWRQGFSRQGPAWFRFLGTVLLRHRRVFPEAVRLGIMGYHFEMVTRQGKAVHDLRQWIEEQARALEGVPAAGEASAVAERARAVIAAADGRRAELHPDFRPSVDAALRKLRDQAAKLGAPGVAGVGTDEAVGGSESRIERAPGVLAETAASGSSAYSPYRRARP